MVYRVYVEKKLGQRSVEASLYKDIVTLLQIENLKSIRIVNRYDVENIDKDLFDKAVKTVFSEPQIDDVFYNIDLIGNYFAVEYLPGQFDQRADSASQCIQIISQGEKPLVKSAKLYILEGDLTENELDKIKKHLINPVEARLASIEEYKTLKLEYELPTSVAIIKGFISFSKAELDKFIEEKGLAMDSDDIAFCQKYFIDENRDPTITEIKMIDTYWSDHCRHTTFSTTIDSVIFEDEIAQKTYEEYLETRKKLNRTKPINLMDLATIAVKSLKAEGKLDKLDESDEINACTIKIKVNIEGNEEDYLLLFKNETHNHPTEIEPFGGAATCIGGAIRDPLSGRAYVYGAMRVTGAGNPLTKVEDTLKGKLPQRTIVTTSANGYSSYGNQIGLATGIVDEIYHDGYTAKRMEIGAVIGSVPMENVRRECPTAGDAIILLGGKTGRDGCGGATGSSKAHKEGSLETCGAEVQKGNAPEERKLQRLFRNKQASLLIKRCNDFGAGGVSVAIGELADGLEIDLNKVTKKYEGLDGTELAISESQERMAVVVEAKDVQKFLQLADSENLEATVVATVLEQNQLIMRWNGKIIVDLKRDFLNSNGAEKHITIKNTKPLPYEKQIENSFTENYKKLAGDLNVCSKKGLSERFDSTIGAGSVMMPFGGKYQLSPIQAMVNKVSVENKDTDTVSLMAYGYNPFITEKNLYNGAYLSVIESVTKLISTGAEFKDVYLTFQEYFERVNKDPLRWGKPLTALLGAFKAQTELKIGAIGGKDSMSGSFENIDVPPTLVSFAVTTSSLDRMVSTDFKATNSNVYIFMPKYENGLPTTDSLLEVYQNVSKLTASNKVLSAYTPTYGGVAEAIMKMSFGNKIGFKFSNNFTVEDIFSYNYGAIIVETNQTLDNAILLGNTTESNFIEFASEMVNLEDLLNIYESKLEPVYPVKHKSSEREIPTLSYNEKNLIFATEKFAKPKVLIPVFPGTNCEYDSKKAIDRVGGNAEIYVINNLSGEGIARSVKEFSNKIKESQMVFIPGGFSGGDEPDGSGKFITAFFRNANIKDSVTDLLDNREGLMAGVCNGFQALIKLGLVPFGKIIDTDASCPTLTYNSIHRHQSMLVRTRVCSNKSPWLSGVNVGDIVTVPISHGEGRFLIEDELLQKLISNGQIATQYVDLNGQATSNIAFNPNNSVYAIEGITSPDGRVFGKMGHSERYSNGLYKNVEGNFDIKMFESAVKYFK